MKFKVGDLVRQINNLRGGENPLAIVVEISGTNVFHRHRGTNKISQSGIEDFEFVNSNGIDLSHIKQYGIVKFINSLEK